MKATKKIVGAACALVAAVALSAGSTFAWFATSNTVSVTEMKVQATVPMNLYIEGGYELDMTKFSKTSLAINDSEVTPLTPAAISTDTGAALKTITGSGDSATATVNNFDGSTASTTLNVLKAPELDDTAKWEVVPTSGTSGVVAANGYSTMDTFTFASTGVTADADKKVGDKAGYVPYVYKQDMTLANKGMEINVDATVTISWAQGSTDTYKFIRVGFVLGTPTLDSDGNVTAWTYAFKSLQNDISTVTNVSATNKDTIAFEYEDLIKNFVQDSLTTVTFLVWFDGDDPDCFVDNAIKVNAFSIDINFVGGDATSNS